MGQEVPQVTGVFSNGGRSPNNAARAHNRFPVMCNVPALLILLIRIWGNGVR